VAAIAGVADYFIPLLIGLGIVSAPLAGVYVVDFFVLRERGYDASRLSELPAVRTSALAAWLMGSAVGLAETYAGHALTGIPALDSILVTALGHALMNSTRWRVRREPAVRP
jgi:purine-cytosine permease-like protein